MSRINTRPADLAGGADRPSPVPDTAESEGGRRISFSTVADLAFVDLAIDHRRLLDDSRRVVAGLFPSWNTEQCEFTQCTDGTTNKLVRVSQQQSPEQIPDKTPRVVLIRTYGVGSELLINRDQELVNLVALSKLKLAPPLYGRFRNGIVYGFVNGRVVGVHELGNPQMSLLIADQMARWHSVHVDTGAAAAPQPALFRTLRKWLALVPETYADGRVNAQFQARFDVEALRATIDDLAARLPGVNSDPATIVFSHNDLLSANIIYNEMRDKVYFIDFEYGSYNYRGFDIANHFCEFAGFEGDYSRYPDADFQRRWLRRYWQAHRRAMREAAAAGTVLPALSAHSSLNDVAGDDGDALRPTEAELDAMLREIAMFSLASHVFWGLWALVQAHVSDIAFDYIGYAQVRFDEYERQRSRLGI